MTAAPPSEIWRRVAGGDRPALVEGGAQRGEGLGSRLGADSLVGVDDQRIALPLGHLHRDDLLGEPCRP